MVSKGAFSSKFAGFILVLVALILSQPAWASISARLSKSQIYVGDTVTLEIAATGRQSDQPDLSPLRKDFDVLGTGSGSQIQIVNGKRSERQTWSIRLRPRMKGDVSVPPISVGSEQTPTLLLKVVDIPVSGSSGANEVFLQADVAEESVYVQQQIRLTMRLYHRWPLLSGEWSEPTIEDAVVERLSKDKRYQATRNGVIYEVIERQYAIFPERSGELKIPFTRFAGDMQIPGQKAPSRPSSDPMIEQFFGYDPFANDFFDRSPFNRPRGKAVRALSPELTVEVKPIPPALNVPHWMPAESVTLKDSWATSPPDFSKGQPVTRTIEIEAKGLAASQIPALEFADQPDVGIYSESPVTSTRTDGIWAYGRTRQTITYVPKKNGLLSIPEVRLSWWNTQTDKADETVLQSWNLNVAGLEEAAEPVAPSDEEKAVSIDEKKMEEGTDTSADSNFEQETSAFDIYKPVFLGAGLGILALFLLALWFARKTAVSTAAISEEQASDTQTASNGSSKDALAALKTACDSKDANSARKAMLAWAQAHWTDKPHHNLQSIAAELGDNAAPVLELDRAVYGGDSKQWDGMALWQAIQMFLEQGGREASNGPQKLDPLYPDHS